MEKLKLVKVIQTQKYYKNPLNFWSGGEFESYLWNGQKRDFIISQGILINSSDEDFEKAYEGIKNIRFEYQTLITEAIPSNLMIFLHKAKLQSEKIIHKNFLSLSTMYETFEKYSEVNLFLKTEEHNLMICEISQEL